MSDDLYDQREAAIAATHALTKAVERAANGIVDFYNTRESLKAQFARAIWPRALRCRGVIHYEDYSHLEVSMRMPTTNIPFIEKKPRFHINVDYKPGRYFDEKLTAWPNTITLYHPADFGPNGLSDVKLSELSRKLAAIMVEDPLKVISEPSTTPSCPQLRNILKGMIRNPDTKPEDFFPRAYESSTPRPAQP